jgi:hypothetical protein
MKIRRVGADLFHSDGQTHRDGLTDRQTDRETDMTKLIFAFRNFSNAPKTLRNFSVYVCMYVYMYVCIYIYVCMYSVV